MPEDIEALVKRFPSEKIRDYLQLVQSTARAEFLHSGEAYFRTWSPHEVIEMGEAYHIFEYIPGVIPIGDNGGKDFLCYMTGHKGWGIYAVAFGNIERDDAVWIAASLEDLLVHEIGLEALR
jgi:hypothetical protein